MPSARDSFRQKVRATATEEILQAAEKVSIEMGLDQASMATIAERAGLAVGTLYNYFRDKDELIQALVDSRRNALADALQHCMEKNVHTPFRPHLEEYVNLLFHESPFRRRFFQRLLEADSPRWRKRKGTRTLKDTLLEHCTTILAKGRNEKLLRSEPELPALLAGMLHALFLSSLQDQGDAPSPELMLSVFLEGALHERG